MRKVGLSLTVALLGVILSGSLAMRVLSSYDWNPTVFVGFGRDATAMREYGESLLDYELILRNDLGHDGQAYFALANDPWLQQPEEHAANLDRPRYRAQRILYPQLTSVGGLLNPMATVWTLIVVNVLAVGLGTFAVAQLAVTMGGSPWWGLAFTLNVGLVSELIIDGSGIVAAAAAFAAVLALQRRHLGIAITFLSLAALTREVMLLVALGMAFWLWRQGRTLAALASFGIPLAVVAAWWLYARERLGGLTSAFEVQEIGAPFVGFVSAFESWLESPLDLAAGMAVLVVLLLFLRRVIVSRDALLGWAFVGFVPLAFLFTAQVWRGYFDITRAVAPVITAFLLLAFVYRGEDSAAEPSAVVETDVDPSIAEPNGPV